MKLFLFTTLLFLIFTNLLYAQNGSIQGTVSDQITKDKIPFATILLIAELGNNQKGDISDGAGRFEIDNLKPGNYKLQVSFMGYRTDTLSKVVTVSYTHLTLPTKRIV